jgi:hypothetical protein
MFERVGLVGRTPIRFAHAHSDRRKQLIRRQGVAVARVVAGGELLENPARSALAFKAGRERPRRAPNRLRRGADGRR